MKAMPKTGPVGERAAGRESVLGRGLQSWHIYLLFAFWTLFSVFVFSQFSTLGDSQSYLTGAYDDGNPREARTLAITFLAETVFAVVHSMLLAQLVFSMFAASGVAYLFKHARLHGPYRWAFLAIVLVPNFGVWASVVGRESIFVGSLGFFMGAVLNYYRRPRFRALLLALVSMAAMIFIRAPYGLGFALFLLMFLLYRSGPRVGVSTGVHALFMALTALLALAFAWPYLDAYITGDVLPRAESFFTVTSDTTRTWIDMDTTAELFTSLWWSMPLALVGPTPAEVLDRPLMLPFLLSGLVVLGCLLYSIRLAFATPRGTTRKILVLGWLPAVVFILIAYVPFGIYNPGSAIRYASCFLLFLIFPPMLLSAIGAELAASRARERAMPPRPPGHAPVPGAQAS